MDPGLPACLGEMGDGGSSSSSSRYPGVAGRGRAEAQRVATVGGGAMVRGSDDAECDIPVVEKQSLKAVK
jgi:hypothetical protein